MKIDLTTGTWQDNPGCPINITLVSTYIIKVREDNEACIAMVKNPKFTPRTKHIAITSFLEAYYHSSKS
jgi:hypothetical protein